LQKSERAHSAAPPFQIEPGAQPLVALPPYGCGLPLAGTSLGFNLILASPLAWESIFLVLMQAKDDLLRQVVFCLGFCGKAVCSAYGGLSPEPPTPGLAGMGLACLCVGSFVPGFYQWKNITKQLQKQADK